MENKNTSKTMTKQLKLWNGIATKAYRLRKEEGI